MNRRQIITALGLGGTLGALSTQTQSQVLSNTDSLIEIDNFDKLFTLPISSDTWVKLKLSQDGSENALYWITSDWSGIECPVFIELGTRRAYLLPTDKVSGLALGMRSSGDDFDPQQAVNAVEESYKEHKELLGGTINNTAFDRLMRFCQYYGASASVPMGSYLFTIQQTIPHGVKCDFNNSIVALDLSELLELTSLGNTFLRGSVFQMGSNTQLKNISRLLHMGGFRTFNHTGTDIQGMIKLGEFSVRKLNKTVPVRENTNTGILVYLDSQNTSPDTSYYDVHNVSIENVHGYMYLTREPEEKEEEKAGDSIYPQTLIADYANNFDIRVRNISLNGIGKSSDGSSSAVLKYARAVYRSESCQFDNTLDKSITNGARSLGGRLELTNIYGSHLATHRESAVVSLHANQNTYMKHIVGTRTGQVLNINTSTFDEIKGEGYVPDYRGKNGINIYCEDIIGNALQALPYEESLNRKVAGIAIRGITREANDDTLQNRFSLTLKTINLTSYGENKLDCGILINGYEADKDKTFTAPAGVSLASRIAISDVEVSRFPVGIWLEDYSPQTHIDSAKVSKSDNNGLILMGHLHRLSNVTSEQNNQAGRTDIGGYHGHGISVYGQQITLENCTLGNTGSGTETQLNGVYIPLGTASVTLDMCAFHQVAPGGYDIYQRDDAKDAQVNPLLTCYSSIGGPALTTQLAMSPHTENASARISQGQVSTSRCTLVPISGGYRVAFLTPFANTRYQTIITASSGTAHFNNKTPTSVDVMLDSEDAHIQIF